MLIVYDKRNRLAATQNGVQRDKTNTAGRGWLKKINEPDLSGADNDLFGMELMYNEGLTALNGTAQYNGNISGIKWKSGSYGSVQKAYGLYATVMAPSQARLQQAGGRGLKP